MAREKPVEMPTLGEMIAQDCATYRRRAADLEAALRIIAAMPMTEQDDMLAANMRSIARNALQNSRLSR